MWRERTIMGVQIMCGRVGIEQQQSNHQRQAGTVWSAISSRVAAKMEGDRLCGPWLTLIEGEGDGAGA
jgi:hypothetical protein